MRHVRWFYVLVALISLVVTPPSAMAMMIGVTGSVGDLDGDGDATPEDAVVREAVRCWNSRIVSDRTFILDVSGEPLSGGTIAQGATSELDDNDIPIRGFLRIDNDGSNVFYIDPDPGDSTEWTRTDPRSPWRLVGGPATVDLFSIVLHEMGHSLGWLCGDSCGWDNPRYDALMNPAPGDFADGPMCVSPFPFRGEATLPGCVHLQSGDFNVSLRGDGLGDAVNDLSHMGVSGDLMLGFYDAVNFPRETMSPENVAMFAFAYGDVVNLPPLIDAGPDVLSECNMTGGSGVTLDGSATQDWDGGSLQYAWACPDVDLSGAYGPVATGFFPLDSDIVCRFDVGDTASCPPVADFVRVQVQDTTPPTIVCPPSAVVECTGNNGIDADDPQLVPFFGGVAATDVCDASLALVNDAPDFLPLGDTSIGFTATDDSANASSCAADVSVRDTIVPTIAVTLDRTELWPPNHKLATIESTVTVGDVCDPNPTFLLTSITSDEPDDGLGDGDFPNDIQGEVAGTPDVEFQLRSERSGKADGRTYTIVFTAYDGSGNSNTATVEVRVPHDGLGSAKSGDGFSRGGTDLMPGAKTFDLVILSSAYFDAGRVALPTAEIGNVHGVLGRLSGRMLDANNDRLADLVVTFPASDARALKALADDESLALRYETSDGEGYLVEDIFALGSPLKYRK